MRKWFYLLLGFTFPFFWTFHATGMMKILYLPIQKLASTTSAGWPSFVSACLLYGISALIFELTYRVRKNLSPE